MVVAQLYIWYLAGAHQQSMKGTISLHQSWPLLREMELKDHLYFMDKVM